MVWALCSCILIETLALKQSLHMLLVSSLDDLEIISYSLIQIPVGHLTNNSYWQNLFWSLVVDVFTGFLTLK